MRSLYFCIFILIACISLADACKRKTQKTQPEESSLYLIEGDIAVPRTHGNTKVYNAYLKDTIALWPKAIVPYTFETVIGKDGPESVFLPKDIEIIEAALNHITEEVPCITFVKVEKSEKSPKLIFTTAGDKQENSNNKGCWSYVGFQGYTAGYDGQAINLGGPYCYNIGTIIHEVMHSLGATHEQSRPDRDDYIEVLWENIENGQSNTNYRKKTHAKFSSCNTPYDFNSIMHYEMNLMSKNGRDTMVTRDPTQRTFIRPTSEMTSLSKYDSLELGAVYQQVTMMNCFKRRLDWNGTDWLPIINPTCT